MDARTLGPDHDACHEALRRLDDYLDRELSPAEMRRVREHLDTCDACATRFAFAAEVVDQLKEKLRRIAVPSGLLERLEARLAAEATAGDPVPSDLSDGLYGR